VFAAIVFIVTSAAYMANVPVANERVIASALLACAAGTVLLWNAEGPRTAAVAFIALLVCCELSLTFLALLPSRFDKARTTYLAPMAQLGDVVDYLRTRPQPVRVDVDRQEVHFNFGDFYGVEEIGGYLASLTTNTRMLEWASPRVHQLLGVNYALAKEQKDPGQELLFTGESGFKVFRNPGAFDRVRLVHDIIPFKQERELMSYMVYEKNDLSAHAPIVGEAPRLENCSGPEDVMLLKHSAGHEVMLANANCRAMVVIAETNYPGWRATVDGAPVRIWAPYGVLRGIVVDKGSHRIELTYRPASVIWGAICSVVGLLVVLVLQFARPRQRIARAAPIPDSIPSSMLK
jgi:hypothetical protein